jgi:hypothetical protein
MRKPLKLGTRLQRSRKTAPVGDRRCAEKRSSDPVSPEVQSHDQLASRVDLHPLTGTRMINDQAAEETSEASPQTDEHVSQAYLKVAPGLPEVVETASVS